MIETVVLFVITLLVVVFVHEAGHFLVSKGVGVEVEEFGIGFPPRIVGKMWKGTLYSLNALPIGAFVKSKGENDPSVEGSLAAQRAWRRLLVYGAGPGANIILGFFLFTAFFALPRGMIVSDGVLVYEVHDGSAAQAAGIRSGDVILQANGVELEMYDDLQKVLANTQGEEAVSLEIVRDGGGASVSVTPSYSDVLGRNVIGITLGRNIVSSVEAGSPADLGGILPGDSLIGVNDMAVVNAAAFDSALASAIGDEPARLSMLRGDTTYTVEFGGPGIRPESLGLGLRWAPSSRIEIRRATLTMAATASASYIVAMPAMILAALPIMREDPSLAFVGPIGAGQLTVEAVRVFGPSNLIFIAGLISLGIALFNLLPVPPLDGGGMLVALIEAARRDKRLSARAVRAVYAIGTSLLVTLMILITTSDLLRLFQGRGFGL